MDVLEKLAPIVESFATTGALVAAGIWAYLAFIRQRIRFPRLKTSMRSTPVQVAEGWILRIEIQIENIGSILTKIKQAQLRLRQVVPLPPDVAENIRGGVDPVPVSDSQVLWPCLAQRNWDGEVKGIEVEPGEIECLHADFFVPREVSVVELY